MRRLIPLALAGLVVAGCGHSSSSSTPPPPTPSVTPTTSTPTTTTGPGETTEVRVYLLRNGKVAPVARSVSSSPAVAADAVRKLAAGPTGVEHSEGLTSAYPGTDPVTSIAIDSGVATVTLAQDLPHTALGQLVYTLTQFSTVQRVRTSRMIAGAPPLTRAMFEDVTPQILVESPLPGEGVTSPLRLRGTANTFEATFDVELRNSSGVRIAWRFVTATSGSGTRGTYDTTISFPHTGGPLTLVAYEPSAENGKPIHVVRIPLQEA